MGFSKAMAENVSIDRSTKQGFRLKIDVDDVDSIIEDEDIDFFNYGYDGVPDRNKENSVSRPITLRGDRNTNPSM